MNFPSQLWSRKLSETNYPLYEDHDYCEKYVVDRYMETAAVAHETEPSMGTLIGYQLINSSGNMAIYVCGIGFLHLATFTDKKQLILDRTFFTSEDGPEFKTTTISKTPNVAVSVVGSDNVKSEFIGEVRTFLAEHHEKAVWWWEHIDGALHLEIGIPNDEEYLIWGVTK